MELLVYVLDVVIFKWWQHHNLFFSACSNLLLQGMYQYYAYAGYKKSYNIHSERFWRFQKNASKTTCAAKITLVILCPKNFQIFFKFCMILDMQIIYNLTEAIWISLSKSNFCIFNYMSENSNFRHLTPAVNRQPGFRRENS